MTTDASLLRVVGLRGAVAMGLGSIVGTGIFVTIGTATGVAGSSVLLAIMLAAVVASCNGLASAQLAAAHPVSGGAYEYGYRYLGKWPARLAGVTFVCAKTASAATAALGFGGYVLVLAQRGDRTTQIALAVTAVVGLTAIVAGGIQRSHRTNLVIVAVTLASLATFVVACLPSIRLAHLELGSATSGDVAYATALVFVAYTGYGRIATLGEEVREPARTIPRAIVITLLATLVLYVLVAGAAIGRAGAPALAAATHSTSAPLEVIAPGWVQPIVAVGAITAMLGVLLNLVLGISRVVLAMARRKDLPTGLAAVERNSPRRAVVVVGSVIAALALIGSVKTTWTISAFTVLLYYSVMNLCALRQPRHERRIPRAIPASGLVLCLVLALIVLLR
jgi:APA family basic amino acid/polyamine antiporter